jgi:hypothetical protein
LVLLAKTGIKNGDLAAGKDAREASAQVRV